MASEIAPSISYPAKMRSGDVLGMRLQRASNWGLRGLIAAAVLLSPVLAFLMALVVDIVIGFLKDGLVPALLVLVAAGAIGGFLFRKLRMARRARRRQRLPHSISLLPKLRHHPLLGRGPQPSGLWSRGGCVRHIGISTTQRLDLEGVDASLAWPAAEHGISRSVGSALRARRSNG